LLKALLCIAQREPELEIPLEAVGAEYQDLRPANRLEAFLNSWPKLGAICAISSTPLSAFDWPVW